MATTKNMLLRLDPEVADQMAAIADVEGKSVSDIVREAIAALIEQRRLDEPFQRRLRDAAAAHRRVLDALGPEPAE